MTVNIAKYECNSREKQCDKQTIFFIIYGCSCVLAALHAEHPN